MLRPREDREFRKIASPSNPILTTADDIGHRGTKFDRVNRGLTLARRRVKPSNVVIFRRNISRRGWRAANFRVGGRVSKGRREGEEVERLNQT